jgi:ribosomal protein S18 acetylase RimI-like enzyme
MMRRAEQGDAQAIAAVHVSAWRQAYRGLLPDEVLDQLSVEEREQSWRELLDERHGRWFTVVAVGSDARVEGFCTTATPSRDDDAGERTAEIAATYVDPAHWRAGIGSALLDAALAELRQADYEEVTLWVFADNARARSLYRRFGFEPDGGEARHDWSGGQLEVRLRAVVTR